MDSLLTGLRAAGEPTRLRILAVLDRSELTVGELCRVLNQTQPRVSRHLRLLVEGGLLERHAQGTSAFFRLARAGKGRDLFDAIRPLIDADGDFAQHDLRLLQAIRSERADAAATYFAHVAADWDSMRKLHVADAKVEAALLTAIHDLSVRDLLDVGTGTGRILEVFADQVDRGVGVDLSKPMLDLARSRLDQGGLRHCSVRQGNVYDLSPHAGSCDVAVLHHVLHFLDDPAAAIDEVATTIRADGRLLIVDFATHNVQALRDDHAHHWLGFAESDVIEWCNAAGFVDIAVTHLTPNRAESDAPGDRLTTTIWCATQRAGAPSLDARSQHGLPVRKLTTHLTTKAAS